VPDLAHSEATSPRLVELRIALAERTGFVVTVAEGEMARLDTPTVRLGLQTKIVGEQLKIFVYRLKVLGTGESAEYLESRVLPAGNAALRVRVAGVVLEITWSGEIPAGVAAARLPRNQCCLVCAGLTMCAQSVSGTCGGCQGDAKRDRHPEQ
jgi:hypothetical protein